MTEKEIFERQVEDLMHYGYERHQAVNIVEDGHYQDTVERELYFHDESPFLMKKPLIRCSEATVSWVSIDLFLSSGNYVCGKDS